MVLGTASFVLNTRQEEKYMDLGNYSSSFLQKYWFSGSWAVSTPTLWAGFYSGCFSTTKSSLHSCDYYARLVPIPKHFSNSTPWTSSASYFPGDGFHLRDLLCSHFSSEDFGWLVFLQSSPVLWPWHSVDRAPFTLSHSQLSAFLWPSWIGSSPFSFSRPQQNGEPLLNPFWVKQSCPVF